MISSNRIGLIFLLCGVLFVTLLARTRMQGAPVAQMTPCLDWTDGVFTFALDGYRTNDDGSHTLTWQVTNNGKQDISYVAFGTANWLRLQPQQGSLFAGALGSYRSVWTNERGNPGFASVKYETQVAGFGQGASETFTLVVRNFDPATPIQVQAKAGRTVATAQFTLSAGACDRTPPTPTPTTPFSPLPTPTATPEGYTLPADPVVAACLFAPPAGGIAEEPVIPLSTYIFSEPQVVLTNTAPIGIQQWLPDSETLLVTREALSSQLVSVGLVNTNSGEVTEIVEPRKYLTDPRWLSTNQTVIWRELGSFQDNVPGYWEPGYWTRSFDPPGEIHLSGDGNGSGISHDVSPDGKEVVFLALPGGTQPYTWNQETKTVRSLPVDLANWRYGGPIFYRLQPFNVRWHPGGGKILFWDGTWVFLYDLTTHSGCEIDVRSFDRANHYVFTASWSPNGRYLLLKNAGSPPYTSTHGPHDRVLVLDTYTGEAVQYALGHPVAGFVWAPDSQTVALTGLTGKKIGRFDMHGTYVLNILSGEYRQILPDRDTANVQWSPDGTRLVFQCHDFESATYLDRICTSQMSMNQ
jgi:Tol biopolymer transport system component